MATDVGQCTPTDNLALQLCHSYTYFSKHIFLQLVLNGVQRAAPQGLCFPSAGNVSLTGKRFCPMEPGFSNQTNYFISSPLAPSSRKSSSEDISDTHTKGLYFEIKPQCSPKDLSDWTGSKQTPTYFLAADSIAQAGTKHLLAALCLEPLHTHRVHHSVVSYALAVRLRLGLLRLGLVQRSLHIREARRARPCNRTRERSQMSHAKLENRMLQLNAEIIKP